jgi:hypothetical protein
MRIPFLSAMVIVVAAMASAAPVPVLDIKGLIKDAELIVVGAVEHVEFRELQSREIEGRQIVGQLMVGVMRIDQVLKGSLSGTTVEFQFFVPDEFIGFKGLAADSYRMLFLKRSEGAHEFVSAYHPALVAVPGPPVVGAGVEDRVFGVIVRVLEAPVPSSDRIDAIRTLRRVDHPGAIAGLTTLLDDADVAIRLTAAAALLTGGQLVALPIAEHVFLRENQPVDPVLVHNLRVGVSQGIRNASAVASLVRMLTAGNTETRRMASAALAQITSRTAVPPLARALDDADFEVRLNAVRGLAALSGQPRLFPSDETFALNEASFVVPLRAWAAAN